MNRSNTRTVNSTKNFVMGMASEIILIILKFICRTVFINTLGKSYLGVNGLFSDILQMLSLAELGIDTAMHYKLYEPLAKGDVNRVRLLMKFYKLAYIIVGIVILLLGLCLIPFLPYLIKDYDSLQSLNINAIIVFLFYLSQTVTSYLFFASRSAIIKADQKNYICDFTKTVTAVLMNLAQILVLVLWADFLLYIGVSVIFGILANFINAIIAKKKYPDAFVATRDSISKEEIKDTFKDLGALFINKINNVVLKATDSIILSTFIGLAVVGMYSNYLMIYSIVITIINKFYNATKASMGNLYVSGNMGEKYRFFKIMNFLSVLLCGTAAVGIATVIDEFIICWVGEEYVIAQPFSILIGIEIFFTGIVYNLGQVRHVTGLFRQMWYRPLISAIVNITVSIIMVKICGIYGVIIGTIVTQVFTNFLIDPIIIYRYGFENYKPALEYYAKNALYVLVVSAVGVMDYLICRSFVTDYGWISCFVHIAVCGLSVPIVLLLGFWKTDEVLYVKNIFRKGWAKLCRLKRQ